MKTNKTLLITGLITLSLGLLIGWWFGGNSNASEPIHDHTMDSDQTEVWTCSMHPQIRQSEPGQCPLCGMDLIPAASETAEADPMAVKMSSAAMKLAEVQTSTVGVGADAKPTRLTGKVQPNEQELRSQAAHISGRIEELYVDFTGEYIQEGKRLAAIYSPELVTAQKELLVALGVKDMQPELYAAAKRKLRNWKLTDEQIHELEKAETADGIVSVLSNSSGYVLELKVQRGDYVNLGQSLYEVADLSSVWVFFDVYESDLQWVGKGNKVQISVSAFPGQEWNGLVSYVDPVIDPSTRVAKARVELANPGLKLKPEMFATGILVTEASTGNQEPLTVLKSAVMWTGKRSVVYVKSQDANGVYFRMREVELGAAMGESYTVESGLVAGEEIATNGTFSIDAAAQLAGKPSMMSPEGGPAPKGHNHGNQEQPSTLPESPASEHDKKHDEHDPTEKASDQHSISADFADLLDSYFKLKTSLTKSDVASADRYAMAMQEKLNDVGMDAFPGESHAVWMRVNDSLKIDTDQLVQANDINEMRDVFKSLSAKLIKVASAFNGYDSPIYVQYCPMADHNKGGFWLSRQETILNPYFGRSMLGCGSTVRKL